MPDPAKVAAIRAHFPRLQKTAADLGLPVAETPPRLGVDTRAAHEAAAFVVATAPEREHAFRAALYRAHWVEGESLAERATLLRAAERAGVDPAALEAALDGGDYRERVLADEREARERGVTGVPYTFVGPRPLVVGFLPAADLKKSLTPFIQPR